MLSLSNGDAHSHTDMMHVFVSLDKAKPRVKDLTVDSPRGYKKFSDLTPSPTHPLSPSLTLTLAKSYFLTVLNYNPYFSYILHMYCLNKYSLMITGKKTFTSQNNKAINQI